MHDFGMINAVATMIVAFFSFLGTMAGAYFSNKKSAALMEYKIDQLEAKVDKHNQVVERTYHLEEMASVFIEKLKVINHRLSDLEGK